MRTAALVVVVCLAAIAGAGRARADCPLPVVDASARQHCDAGANAYAGGDFPAAAREFAAAYQIQAEPGLLYAWAQARRLGGACAEALELYRRYLDTKPNDAQTTATRGWIAECEKLVPPVDPPPVDPPPVDPPPVDPPPVDPPPVDPPTPEQPTSPRPWYRNRLGVGLAIGGVVGIGVGTGYMIAAWRSDQRAGDAEFLDDHNAALDQAHARRRIGYIALGAGAAFAIGSAISFVLGSRRDHPAIAVAIDGDGEGMVVVGGSF